MKIVLISSGQPSANPRLVKEAIALSSAGYSITVIYCPLSSWADEFDRKLFERYPNIKWVRAGYHSAQEKWKYYFARGRRKLYEWLFLFIKSPLIAVRSMVLFEQELYNAAKKENAILFIGHNLGALPVVIKAIENKKTKAAFDFEDYHRGEDVYSSEAYQKTKMIEEVYVPKLSYATAASPLINKVYSELFPALDITTIQNCFPLKYSNKELLQLTPEPLKLFWFSQFIGLNRGLEVIIDAIGQTQNQKIELTLVGVYTSAIEKKIRKIARENGLCSHQLIFLAPMPEHEIVQTAAKHHIGIASEINMLPNRDVCLTNKIYMYLLAGNAILFSDTTAQRKFLRENPSVGTLYKQSNSSEIAEHLQRYISDPNLLWQHRSNAFELGKQKFNWEMESKILVGKVNSILSGA